MNQHLNQLIIERERERFQHERERFQHEGQERFQRGEPIYFAELFQRGEPIYFDELIRLEDQQFNSAQTRNIDLYENIRQPVISSRWQEEIEVVVVTEEHKVFVKTLTEVEIETICEDCAICFNKPTKLDSITTECGHEFCKGCYIDYIATTNRNKSCPLCRKNNPKITTYRT